MGQYVHIHVAFACRENGPVAELAKKHRPLIESVDGGDGLRAAQWFLDDLSGREGPNRGPKGGVSLWGMIGNYTEVDEFVEVLRPFWMELLRTEAGGICDFEHILVFGEREGTYEIYLEDERRGISRLVERRENNLLVVKTHECPFTFMQM